MPRPQHTRRPSASLLEALEPRQLLSALPFIVNEDSPAILGTLADSHFTISSDTSSHGSALQATINWGDGSSSPATLQRDTKGRIQIVGDHTYAAVQHYTITVLGTVTTLGLVATASPKSLLKTTANVLLSSAPGTTLALTTGQAFSGAVASIDRGHGPKLTSPQSAVFSATLPASVHAQIDWGDGTLSDASFLSHGNKYDILGSHTYSAPGSYRIIVHATAISINDGSTLDNFFIYSTAHVAAAGASHAHFTLPTHADLPTNNSNTPPTDSGGVLNLGNGSNGSDGGSATVAGGGLIITNTPVTNGTDGSILTLSNGSGSLTTGGGLTIGTSNSSSGTILLNGGSLTIITGQPPLTPITGLPGTITVTNGTSSLSSPVLVLSAPSSWTLHADNTFTPTGSNGIPVQNSPSGLVIVAPILATFNGTLTIDPDAAPDLILSTLTQLPSTFSGTLNLPASAADLTLPAFLQATVNIAPPLTP